jgi:uncharacterized membrane protein YhaH (DUF805 family)
MLDLLFSPFGSVGRGTWWAARVLKYLVFAAVLFSIALLFKGGPHYSFSFPLRFNSPENAAFLQALNKRVVEHPGASSAVLIAVAAVLWVNFVVEIKRWHDRGMSGFWYLLHFAGIAGLASSLPLLSLLIGLFQLINLGFLGSYDPSSKPGFLARAWNVLLPLVAAVGILAVAAGGIFVLKVPSKFWANYLAPPHLAPGFAFLDPGHVLGSGSATDTNAAPQSPTIAPPAPPLDESAFHGTAGTNFGADWVAVNGVTISGITAVTAVPGAQVALLNHDGGMNVPAASLPQGFLDAWKITPDMLKAKNQP